VKRIVFALLALFSGLFATGYVWHLLDLRGSLFTWWGVPLVFVCILVPFCWLLYEIHRLRRSCPRR